MCLLLSFDGMVVLGQHGTYDCIGHRVCAVVRPPVPIETHNEFAWTLDTKIVKPGGEKELGIPI